VKDARCILVTGRRGSGKTTLVQTLIEGCPALIAFDPIGQYAREFGWARAATLDELHRKLSGIWGQGFKIAFSPAGDFARELHRLSVYLWAAQVLYETGRTRRKLSLVVEEMNLSFPVTRLPDGCQGFLRLVLQGRHRGIEIIGVTQRPALVSADFRGNVAETYVFALGYAEDQRLWGRACQPIIASLAPHAYLRLADGEAARGQNPPLRPSRRSARG
jgi:hypothetical protein